MKTTIFPEVPYLTVRYHFKEEKPIKAYINVSITKNRTLMTPSIEEVELYVSQGRKILNATSVDVSLREEGDRKSFVVMSLP